MTQKSKKVNLPKRPVPPKTPTEPKKPEEPSPKKIVYENKALSSNWNDSGQSYSLAEVIKILPEEFDIEQTLLSIENDDGFVKIYVSFPAEVENKDYNTQLKSYRIKLEKYNLEMAAYERQMIKFLKENEIYQENLLSYKKEVLELETSKELETIRNLEEKLQRLKNHVNKDSK